MCPVPAFLVKTTIMKISWVSEPRSRPSPAPRYTRTFSDPSVTERASSEWACRRKPVHSLTLSAVHTESTFRPWANHSLAYLCTRQRSSLLTINPPAPPLWSMLKRKEEFHKMWPLFASYLTNVEWNASQRTVDNSGEWNQVAEILPQPDAWDPVLLEGFTVTLKDF